MKTPTTRRTLLVVLAATLAFAASAAPAPAAVLEGTNASELQYTAAVGETNRLRVTQTGLTVRFDDDVAITATNPACSAAAGDVTCTAVIGTTIGILLQDLNDETTLSGVSLPTNQAGADGDDVLRGGDGPDNFFEGPGADTYRGNAGDDTHNSFVDSGPLSVTLDGVANDGSPGEGDNIGGDVEDVYVDTSMAVTIVGTAGPNVVYAFSSAATIDGGAGNDVLFGDGGADVITARDGYLDRIDCAGGSDTAVVDTLDVVSGRETVDRADVGNANDIAEDRPPAIAFLAPAANALIAARGTSVTFTATDDRAIASVTLYDDGRIVGSATAAPFAIAYAPRGDDVGANTLVAIATDSAGQTATEIRRVRVARFAAVRLSSRVAPARDRSAPHRFRVTGRLSLPARVTAAQGCAAGAVTVRLRLSGTTVSSRRVALRRNCTYSATLRGRAGRLRATARFHGNTVLAARSAAPRSARAG